VKRGEKMLAESPDPQQYFNPVYADIASGTHAYDNNTEFFYEEDADGNISYGMRNYSPDGGLDNEDIREAKTIEEARKNVIAMIDAFGEETGTDSTSEEIAKSIREAIAADDKKYPVGTKASRNVKPNSAPGEGSTESWTKTASGEWTNDETGEKLSFLPPSDDTALGREANRNPLDGNFTGGVSRGPWSFEKPKAGGKDGGKPPTPPTPPVTPTPEDGGESIDDVLARLDLVNDDDFINKAVDTMFDPENGSKTIKTDEYEFGGSVSVDQIMQEGSFDGFLEVFDPQGGDSQIFEISFPMSGFESLEEQYTRAQMAQKIKEALAEAGVGTVAEADSGDRGTPEQTKELLDLLRAKILNENGDLPAGLVRQNLYRAALDGDNVARYFSREEMETALQELRVLPDRNATPEQSVNITDPQQLLEGDIFDTIAMFVEQGFENSAEFGNVRISAVPDYLSDENTLSIFVEYTDADGNIREYSAVYPLSENDGIIVGPNETAREAVYSDLKAQIDAEATPAETVTEIAPAPALMMGSYNLNSLPSATELRRAKSLDGVSETELQDALTDAIKNGKKSVTIGGKLYSTRVLVVALSSRGFDTDMFIAGQLDQKNGNTSNVDALNAYRAQNPDVTREGTDNAKPATAEEALDAFIAGTSQQELVDLYTDAIQNGRESVVVSLENFGSPEALGSSIVESPLADFRKRLVDKGFDMDSVDDGFKGNDNAKKKIADEMDEDVEDLNIVFRSDWRDVIISGSSEYSHIRFLDEFGVMQEFIRGEDGKWYDTSKPLDNKRLNKGKDSSEMIRYMERGSNVDKDELIYITNGFGYDDSGELIDEAKNAFSFNTPEDDALSPEDAAEVSRWRHITYGDLKKMLKLQKQGVNIDIMDKMQELFPKSERRSEDELVTETHEWTDSKGTKFKFEVVVTKTPNEYYYTYVRITDTKSGKVQSSRAGRMNQSAMGAFRTYRREMTKFHASFFKTGGPVAWFRSGATKIRMKTDQFDEDLGYYTHSKDLQLDRNTTASVLGLLGASPSSTQEVDRASDLVMREIFRYLGKYRHDDVWMGKAVDRLNNGAMFKDLNLGIDKDYLYAVASAYDAQISNQQALDMHGEGISFDQRTPLEVGDTVDYVPSFKVNIRRRGKVVKRLGYVDANGGYRYTDYIMVQWEDGRFQITTTRNNRLIETAQGTDGSERVKYKDGYTDPRGDYGTEATGTDAQDLLPQPLPEPAPAVKPERQTAQRDENSDLILPDGTVVPERPLGQAGSVTSKRPDQLAVGDFVGALNDDAEYSLSPVVSAPVVSEDGTMATVKIVVRQSDGTYTVENASYSMGAGQSVMVKIYGDPVENSATPAQMNEIVELLATKNASVSGNSGLMNYYLGVMEGKDMSGIYSREEVADIIQELRNLPDRTPASPIDQAAELARVVAEDEERNGNTDAAQLLGGLADAAAIVASQGAAPAGGETLKAKVARIASALGLGPKTGEARPYNFLADNTNEADVEIKGSRTRRATKPTDEARDAKDQMMELGAEAWITAQQKIVSAFNELGYEFSTYQDVVDYRAQLISNSDDVFSEYVNSTGFEQIIISALGDLSVDRLREIKKKIEDAGIPETEIYKMVQDAKETNADVKAIVESEYFNSVPSALRYEMSVDPAVATNLLAYFRRRDELYQAKEASIQKIGEFKQESLKVHDQATVDTLKELGVEFDNVAFSAFGSYLKNNRGGTITETSETGRALKEAFERIPRNIILQMAENLRRNSSRMTIATTNARARMRRSRSWDGTMTYSVTTSPDYSSSPTSFDSKYTDTLVHELWHVIQAMNSNVAQLEHAWAYDRIVSTDGNGNDVMPKLEGTGRAGSKSELGFTTVGGTVTPYMLKQYPSRENPEEFFSPNNTFTEVSTMIMQDIFGQHGNASLGTGMKVSSGTGRSRRTYDSKKLFFNETTGKWYVDEAMTDELKNPSLFGRPEGEFDSQVKEFGMGLLLVLSDWSATEGVGSTPERRTYNASDLFFDRATGKWYTDSSKSVEINSADVRGKADGE
jgi:hypothetical protein